jgi:hypothetical protein
MSTALAVPAAENEGDEREVEVAVVSASVVEALSRAELDKQIATAKAYPRDLRSVAKTCKDLVTMNVDAADECIYSLPRGGKTIEGPSARFAESVAYAYGNCRVGARVVDEGQAHVTAQGFFIDLERNTAISFEVKRRITTKDGRRFDADMIAVTGNAACSIALRNAVLRGVPKPLWMPAYDAAAKMVMGDPAKLSERRAAALKYVERYGASEVMVLATLGVDRVEQVTAEHLLQLKGIVQAIKEGEASIESAFTPEWKAIKELDQRAAMSAVQGAVSRPRSWVGDLRARVEKLFGPMDEAAYSNKLSELFNEKDGSSVCVNNPEVEIGAKEAREMLSWLAARSWDRAAERSGAQAEGVVPAAAEPARGTEAPAPAPAVSPPPAEDWRGRLLRAAAKHYGRTPPGEHKNAYSKWVKANENDLLRLINGFYAERGEDQAQRLIAVPPMDHERVALWLEARNEKRAGEAAPQAAGGTDAAPAPRPKSETAIVEPEPESIPAPEDDQPAEAPEPQGYERLVAKGHLNLTTLLLAMRHATKGEREFVNKSAKSGRYELKDGAILSACGLVNQYGTPLSQWLDKLQDGVVWDGKAYSAPSDAVWPMVCRAVYDEARAMNVSMDY